ncbi:PDZ domain-containing protein [Streptomyces sp. NPDC059063]|uniref:PDZ domain-containing protein n=1 Tax=unclassified Streptomyces TaxID=2593676 RepID=UPI003698E039
MEQTALRPKPMPGHEQDPGRAPAKDPKGHRPHAARRRGRRVVTLLFALLCAVVLVLAGVGIGTVGATVIGMSRLAEMQQGAAKGAGAAGQRPDAPGQGPDASGTPQGTPTGKAPVTATPSRPEPQLVRASGPRPALGVEAVDAQGRDGALVVGVHQPGPGHAAGLVRGDVVVAFAGNRVRSAGDLAREVGGARPGRAVALTVRHASGARQALSVTPGVLT